MPTKVQNKIEYNKVDDKCIQVIISGVVVKRNADEWSAVWHGLSETGIKEVKFVAKNLEEWDSSLLLLIYNIKCSCIENKVTCNLDGLPQNIRELMDLAFVVSRQPSRGDTEELSAVEKIGRDTLGIWKKINDVLSFIGLIGRGISRLFTFRSVMRKIDFYDALENCGPKAVGIVCLISFLIGLILAFVGAVQLQTFGVQIYVASLVTIGMCRIMGAIMVGIIMAGRTGSSYAATIGTMQVNEEIDALQTMGISRIDFLIMPRLLAMLIAMPILTMISDFLGMIGGAFVGVFMMDLPYQEYWKYSFNAFHLNNFLVGLFHGFCFAFIIALCGCYCGLKCGKNADSVGKATTKSVVSAIVWMIVVTGVITVICQELKL